MWCLGTWFHGGPGSAGLMAGLDDLQDLFQPKLFILIPAINFQNATCSEHTEMGGSSTAQLAVLPSLLTAKAVKS